jgi:hypothetical protein
MEFVAALNWIRWLGLGWNMQRYSTDPNYTIDICQKSGNLCQSANQTNLNKTGFGCLMRTAGLVCKTKRKFMATTKSGIRG